MLFDQDTIKQIQAIAFDAYKTTGRVAALLDGGGRAIAEITFPDIDEDTVDINHTFVDESLRGQGMAGKLMEAAVNQIQSQGKKAVPTCS